MKEMTGVMKTGATGVCGVTRREVPNSWTIGKEEKIERRKEKIKVAVRRRNERMQETDAKRRLRPRREDAARVVELARMRTEVRHARKNMKGYLRGLEQE